MARDVNAFDQFQRTLKRSIESLSSSATAILRPEPRGIGKSVGPMENLSVHDFAKEVAAVVEHEKSGPVVVVLKKTGHAMAPEQPQAMANAIATFANKTYGLKAK
ncbi:MULTISPECIES: hypothetical protein [Pseudomonas]|uniref:alpha/beta fold hydrolase n=1 Tax=Pseudomonas TaxID=286 RepID=UPI001FF4C18A|nr:MULTISPECIES: hypothetical protein [Pseudomonas]